MAGFKTFLAVFRAETVIDDKPTVYVGKVLYFFGFLLIDHSLVAVALDPAEVFEHFVQHSCIKGDLIYLVAWYDPG